MELDYKRMAQIDKNALDREFIELASTYQILAMAAAKAEYEADVKKENLKLMKADLRLDIMSNPSKYGLVKPTEAAIEAAITDEVAYAEEVKNSVRKEYEAEVSRAAVKTLEVKRCALENLVKLHIAGYFGSRSEPNVEGGQDAVRKITQTATRDVIKSRRCE